MTTEFNPGLQRAVKGERGRAAPRTRVLLALAEPWRQASVERILSRVESIEIVASAENGPETVRLTEELSPNLVIMAVDLPMMNGFVATKEIMIRCPTPVLIIGEKLAGMSAMANESAYRAGALNYLPEAPDPHDEVMSAAFLDVVESAAHSEATRYYRIRQSWATDAQIQAVAIFVSNASLHALAAMLKLLPEDFSAPLLILPYVGKGFSDGFASWLSRNCALNVKVANEGDLLPPATVLVAPDNRHLEVIEDRIPRVHLSTAPPVNDLRPSGLHLLGTLARVYGPRGLAIVMGGVREDLVSAMCGVWLEGGRVFAQAKPENATLRWPPEQILHTLADAVMTPADLGAALVRMAVAKHDW